MNLIDREKLKKSILMILPAKDFNEEEFLVIKKTLEKSSYKVFIASDAQSLCQGEAGLRIKADVNILNIHESNFAAVVLIGGNGVKEYWGNTLIHKAIRDFAGNKKPVSAICGAPVILAKAGILKNAAATCWPEDKRALEREGIEYKDIAVVVGKNIITGQNPRAAGELSAALLNLLGELN